MPLPCLYSEVQYLKDEAVQLRVAHLLKNDQTQVLMGLDDANFTIDITDNVFTRPVKEPSEGEILVRNDDLAIGCANTTFYNKFLNATYRFLTPNASAAMDSPPVPQLLYSYDEANRPRSVTVILSGEDQKNLPLNQTVTIIVDLWWTNEEYEAELEGQSAIFRSAVHYVMTSP